MMKSIPVRFSSARMLRPSRPMMRPFMSSLESCTTETVVSAAWLAARRCMATARIERTRRSASRLVSSSTWRSTFTASWRAWSSTSLTSCWRACAALRPETRSSARSCSRRRCSSRARSSSRAELRSAISAARCSSSAARTSSSAARPRSSLARSSSSRRPGVGLARSGAGLRPPPACRNRSAARTRPPASTTAAITVAIDVPLPRCTRCAPRILSRVGATDRAVAARSGQAVGGAARRPRFRLRRW